MSTLISIATFATRKGVSRSAVRTGIESGRIVADENGKIDWSTQSDAWDANRDDSKARGESARPTDLNAARTRKELATAQLKEIELAAAEGRYLEKESVKVAMFKWSRTIRDSVMAIPERVAADLGAAIFAHVKEVIESGDVKKLKRFTESDVERMVRASWSKESREVLESVDKTPHAKR